MVQTDKGEIVFIKKKLKKNYISDRATAIESRFKNNPLLSYVQAVDHNYSVRDNILIYKF